MNISDLDVSFKSAHTFYGDYIASIVVAQTLSRSPVVFRLFLIYLFIIQVFANSLNIYK